VASRFKPLPPLNLPYSQEDDSRSSFLAPVFYAGPVNAGLSGTSSGIYPSLLKNTYPNTARKVLLFFF